MVDKKLAEAFVAYLSMINIVRHDRDFSAFHIATELGLDGDERLKFVRLDQPKKESFLLNRLKYQEKLLDQADKAKNIFHLN